MKAELLDYQVGLSGQDYEMATQYRLGDTLFQVQIKVNAFEFQSYARVQVFTAERSWSTLLNVPPSNWYAGMPRYSQVGAVGGVYEALVGLTERLADRGEKLLEVAR